MNSNNFNYTLLKWTRRLVYATWGLVVVGLFTLIITANYMSDQVELDREAQRLQWRPFLDINHVDPLVAFYYLLGEPEEEVVDAAPLDSIPVGSREYIAVRYLRYHIERKIECLNLGVTPLRISNFLASTLSESEWNNIYQKSFRILVDSIRRFEQWKPLETDIVLHSDSVYTTSSGMGISRNMEKREFEYYRDSTQRLILYPYTYVEYEDVFGNVYNTLLIEVLIFELKLVDSYNIISEQPTTAAVEKHRWDVSVD